MMLMEGTLRVRHGSDCNERPKTGWKLYEKTQSGGEIVIRTKRGRAVKHKELAQALRWIKEHRPGYVIEVEGEGFEGKLMTTN